MYTICSTTESVSQAVDVLLQADYVLLDCEGRDLGCAGGALSLLSLGTPHAEHIFLFDVLTLPHRALQVLFNNVLSHTPRARAITKVVWDGRMDDVELFYSFSCPLENVLDLQLADIFSRAQRGENGNVRTQRVARRAFPMPEVRKLQLEGIHVLNSMDGAVREHKIEGVQSKNESVKKLHTDNLSDVWMTRPLTNELLEYAASDIVRIAALYDHFQSHGYFEPISLLRAQSVRYVALHRPTGKPGQENIFLRGPFLPLSIFQPTPLSPSIFSKSSSLESNPDADVESPSSRECTGCRRMILEEHFPFEGLQGGKAKRKTRTGAVRLQMCKICTLILTKTQYVESQTNSSANVPA